MIDSICVPPNIRNIALVSLMLVCCTQTAWAVPEIVLQTIALESASEPLEGQAMVARVIINRSRASNTSLEAVCLAPKQFSAWNDKKRAKRWLLRHFDSQTRSRAITAYQMAIIANEAYSGIRHYHAKGCSPYWAKGKKPALTVGSHMFYEGIR